MGAWPWLVLLALGFCSMVALGFLLTGKWFSG
jgi:hypothetical protein